MPTSWFRFNPPGVGPNPLTNPLSYTQYTGTPPFTPTGTCICFIFAETQIITTVVRAVITSALSTEIITAVSTQVSTVNVYVCFC